jgi:hypothetical protein
LRVSSLEEVFIEIGEKQKREDAKEIDENNKEAKAEAEDLRASMAELDQVELEKYSCSRACGILNKREFRSSKV